MSEPQAASRDALDKSQEEQTEFLWKQHGYISDFIKFADAKAAFLATFAAGVTGTYVAARSAHLSIVPIGLHSGTRLSGAWTYGSIVLLYATIITSLLVILPRLTAGIGAGPISWVEIAKHKSPAEFFEQASNLTRADRARLLSDQVSYMSGICARKNQLVRISLILFASSLGLMIASIVTTK